MVLQQQPAVAAVYGFLSSDANGVSTATSVKVTVSSGGKDLYTVDASIDATVHQPFGKADGYGPLPCTDCPPYGMGTFSALNKPAPAWKALLHPTKAGGDYAMTVTCTGCAGNATIAINNVAFGDMWYCSGESLPESLSAPPPPLAMNDNNNNNNNNNNNVVAGRLICCCCGSGSGSGY